MSLSTIAEANASALVIGSLIGVNPKVVPLVENGVTSYVVRFAEADAPAASAKLNQLILSWRRSVPAKGGSSVRYDLGNVVSSVIWKQYWWVLVLGGFAGAGIYYVGSKTAKRKKVR